MKNSARLKAVEEILSNLEIGNKPADSVIAEYFKARRFIGSKDKKFIANVYYAMIRRNYEIAWLMESSDCHKKLLAAYALLDDLNALPLEELFSGEPYGCKKLNKADYNHLDIMLKLRHEIPNRIKLNLPEWLYNKLHTKLGDEMQAEILALNNAAPMDLRVNTLKTNRDKVLSELLALGFVASATPGSEIGIRIADRTPIFTTDLFKNGHIEVQDEGSQLVTAFTEAKPSQTVCDFCAGAGGKTLALAAQMKNTGRLYAFDVSNARLDENRKRLARAGVSNATVKYMESENDSALKRHKNFFDIMVIDAPCSGSGTWRRNPDLKLKLTESGLQELVNLQASILKSARRLVRPNGTMIYITCSILNEENELQISRFLAENPSVSIIGEPLKLSPHKTGTDGFFAVKLRCD